MPLLLRLPLRMFTLGSALFALGVIAAWAVDGLWPGRWWPATFAMLVLPWLLLPALVALPVALLARHRLAALILALAGGLFLAGYGELFLPRPAVAEGAAHDGREPLRVMTWNLGPGGTPHPDLADAIRDSKADVVALQELNEAEARHLEAALAADYPHRILIPVERAAYTGKGLLSRHPIVGQQVVVITDPSRPHLQADLDVAGERVRVINVHPHPPPHLPAFRGDGTFREHPVTNADLAVLGRMAVEAEPALLLGDLNSTPRSTAVRALRQAGLRDAFQDAGWGLGATWPATLRGGALPEGLQRIAAWRLPLVRIDYVWHTRPFRAERAWAAPGVGTDHRPVIADLRW